MTQINNFCFYAFSGRKNYLTDSDKNDIRKGIMRQVQQSPVTNKKGILHVKVRMKTFQEIVPINDKETN